MMEAGYETAYVNHSYGQGLMPDTYTAYQKQRFRWAYGAVQILKRHWRELAGLEAVAAHARRSATTSSRAGRRGSPTR